MSKPTKRASSSSTNATKSNKKQRKVVQDEQEEVEEVSSSNFEDSEGDFDGFEDLEAGGSEDEFAGISSSGKNKGKGRELSGSEEEDEEEMGELGNDDEDMIGDDDEDLYANLNGGGAGGGEMDYEEEDDESSHGDEESDSQGSDDEEEEPLAAPTAPEPTKSDRRKAKQPKPLTPAELRALAFAELTASPISNVLATQVATVLDPATPPPPATSPLQPLLKSIHSHFINLPKQKAISLDKLRKKGTVVPDIKGAEGKWLKMDLEWEKPRSEDMRVVGKWAWGGGTKSKGEYVVELAVAMPPTLLQPKDYLFPRFLVKSTHYLVTLASQLPSTLGPITSSYSPLSGSQGYSLDIRSATSKGSEKIGLGKIKGAVLRIRVVTPPDAFPSSKLAPTNNLARPPSLAHEAENAQINPADLPSTPLRSTALHLSSLPLLTNHLKYHHSLSQTYPSYASSARLLQLWASRRSYGVAEGFSPNFWAFCIARSLNAGAKGGAGNDVASLAAGGEAWAGWRKAVEWLATVNWTEGIVFRMTGEQTYSKDVFKTAFAGKPIFVDPTGSVNLVAGVEFSTLEMLRHDARSTISLLLSGIEDEKKFETAFLKEIRPVSRFDNFVRITVPHSPKVDADASIDHGTSLSYLVSSISATLSRALGTRARAFLLSPPPALSISASSSSLTPSSVDLSLGILLDPAESSRLVDQGPSAEDEAACEEFRSFWGSKSELRRFKDGSIVESVVWDQPSPGGLGIQRNAIVGQIVKYILHERHGIPEGNVDVHAGRMDHLLVEPESTRRLIYLEDSVATGKGFNNVITAFDDLSRELKALPELPLAVSSVQPCSPALRYSTIFTPSPRRLNGFESFPDSVKYLEAHDIILTLESSGRWPEDLEGIQKIKAAFLSKIGESLESTRSVVKAQVVFDGEARTVDDNVSLEILTATGYAFRARIFYERSLLLLEEREEQMGVVASTSTSSIDLYSQRFELGPKHHAAISTLQNHFTSYSQTVRLVKRWISSHMLSNHFSDEIIELVVASVFLDANSPYEPPQSGSTGFARVMERLANWTWRDEPLYVPLFTFTNAVTSGKRPTLSNLDKAQATREFQQTRLSSPAIEEFAWIIATEEDVEGKMWSRQTGKVAAARARGLAKATLQTLEIGVTCGGLVVEQLFSPPLSDYAFLIHLDPSVNPRHYQSLTPDLRALSTRSSNVLAGSLIGSTEDDEEEDAVRIGWDPVSDFVTQLERLYPSIFRLFHSAHGSSTIGGIWNPSQLGSRQFKTGLGIPLRPVAVEGGEKAKVEMDKRAVLKEIERFGKGLVTKVELLQE
ncbi:rRNA-processing protein UTP22 [Sporobolomyces salmoneus]|uniref:rRNA-processing protein UTP22 n=1 Tax=Sporobolomyces salmoneus TaxID=183962 RepID=UPI003180157E